MITTLIDLGWCIGKLEVQGDYHHLIIVNPSDVDADTGLPTPAQSVAIRGRGSIINLQKALNEAFPSWES